MPPDKLSVPISCWGKHGLVTISQGTVITPFYRWWLRLRELPSFTQSEKNQVRTQVFLEKPQEEGNRLDNPAHPGAAVGLREVSVTGSWPSSSWSCWASQQPEKPWSSWGGGWPRLPELGQMPSLRLACLCLLQTPWVAMSYGSVCGCLPAGSTPGWPAARGGGSRKVSGPTAILGSWSHWPEWHSALSRSVSAHRSGGRGGAWVQSPIIPPSYLAQ